MVGRLLNQCKRMVITMGTPELWTGQNLTTDRLNNAYRVINLSSGVVQLLKHSREGSAEAGPEFHCVAKTYQLRCDPKIHS